MPTIIDSNTGLTTGAVNLMAGALQQLDMTANIAASAITVTLNRCALSFHHTVQTAGTPVVIAMPTALTLVIAATDSFGAVTADGVRRLVILAYDNAGTIELAASSLAGGVKLDEVGVITTATAATTLTAIKAAAVRTGVAYRVVGFVDATFTTSVGWGSLAVVQPIGGQALAAMSSLGYGQTWQNVTGSRALSTTYYNLTGKPIKVSIKFSNTSGGDISILVNGLSISEMSFGSVAIFPYMSVIVPAGASYSATNNISGFAFWRELR